MRGVAAVTLRLGPLLVGSPEAGAEQGAVTVALAIVRDYREPQRFDLTNNVIHDNVCADDSLAAAARGFSTTPPTRTPCWSKTATWLEPI